MEKNEENKLNINKIHFNLNPKTNNNYSDSDQKQSEKSLNYKRTVEENIIPEKNKIKLKKKLNSVVDIVKSENISFDNNDFNASNNNFPKITR